MYKKSNNTYFKVTDRSTFGSSIIKDLKLLRLLVEKRSTKFKNVWSKKSKDPIGFDCGHLFLDKFRTSFSTNGKPKELYRMQPLRSSEKVESAVVFESPLDQQSFVSTVETKGFKSCVIGVTANGFLFRQDVDTGKRLQTVFLSRTIKFKNIFWESDLTRLVIKSVHSKPLPRVISGNNPHVNNVLLHLALFDVAPLKFVALIPIERSLFGSTITDATSSMGILFVMHRSGLIQLYSTQEIIDKYSQITDLGKPYTINTSACSNPTSEYHANNIDGTGIVGSHPFGIPVNVHMVSKPTLLLEVSSHQHSLSFGGFPWHFVVSPPRQSSVFHVYSIKEKELVGNGIIKSDVLSVEPDQAYFHADHSGRLLHICPHSIRFLKLKTLGDLGVGQLVLDTCFSISTRDNQSNRSTKGQTSYTSSGRLVKCVSSDGYHDPEYDSIQDLDYEDELDLVAVLSSRDCSSGYIGLYDNQTGVLVKEITLDNWDDESEHSIMMERDLIVHICRTPFKKFSCTLYRLTS
ncbi:predicted protein [Nematostella vectensis]|uniref:DDB1- and CUL4-associated factor 17 n=1 Tax=Nematostella vectensis TaxID=45351 RepID=A7RII5_NEMVE|nr:predicted protein [Nematostella vectensis]|eukprot:XP_001640777.1 predicted protein [Nematostella vectensis]